MPHATEPSPEQAIITLRTLHKRYVRKCGLRFRDVPFSARTVPGWIYDPKADSVMLSTGVTIPVRVMLDE
jgi:hypothetical protein